MGHQKTACFALRLQLPTKTDAVVPSTGLEKDTTNVALNQSNNHNCHVVPKLKGDLWEKS